LTVPAPEPLAPAVTRIQELFERAVHEQPLPALTDTEPLPPLLPNDLDVGEIE
jgi:hypothetical protein